MTLLTKPAISVILALISMNVYGSELNLKGSGQIFNDINILPVDEAFVLQVLRRDGQLEVLWQIRPEHYLYRHRVVIHGSERLGTPDVPEGLAKTDEFFGDVEVYYEGLEVIVPVAGEFEESVIIEYQGCADAGICYPPQKREFRL